MRLKKITIIGFKSFADKAVIDFDCEIIAIVGPNGCGKSNIVDAFRWVMGEQSAKSLRGDKMHDVLFAGTDQRKPLGMAEVSITLTEVGERLPIEYDEVTLTRRLHRSGESEYLINRQPVRLKDIQDLLLGTGVGKNAFSVFEQGKLDQVIHLNPSERRVIFDEAAGIGRFLQRKKEALRKLEQVTENFNRVKDVHVEVDKQARVLKKQAAHAKTYYENKERLVHLEKSLLFTKWCLSSDKEESIGASKQALVNEMKESQASLLNIESAASEDKEAFLAKEREWKNAQKHLFQLQTTSKIQETELKQLQERFEEDRKREEALLAEIERLSKRRQAAFDSIQAKEVALNASTHEKKRFESELASKQKVRTECEKDAMALREAIKKQRAEHLSFFQETNQLQSRLQEKTHQFQLEQKRLLDLSTRMKEKEEHLKAKEQEALSKKQAVAELSALIDQLKDNIQVNDASLSAIQTTLETKKKQQEELSRHYATVHARQQALIRLKDDCEGSSKGVKALLKEAHTKASPLYGKLSRLFECICPDNGFELAVAGAFHFYSDTLVVKTKADLDAVFDVARKKEISDFSILCLEQCISLPSPKKAKKGDLAAFIQAEESYAPFLEGIRVVSNLEEACLAFDGKETATKEGHLIDRRSVIFQIKRGQNETNAFLREAELRELAQSLENLSQERLQKEQEISRHLEEAKQIEHKRRDLLDLRRKKEMSLVEENFILQRALSDKEKASQEIASLQAEKDKLSPGSEKEEALSALKKALLAKQEEEAALLEQAKTKEALLEKLEKSLQLSFQEERQAQVHLRAHLDAWGRLSQEIEIERVKDQEGKLSEEKLSSEVRLLSKKIAASSEALVLGKQKINSLQEELTGQNKVVHALEAEMKESRKSQDSHEKGLLERRVQIGKLEREIHMLELALAQEISVKNTLGETLAERHQLRAAEMDRGAWRLDGNLEDVERTMRELRETIEKSGAVNMMAIEEYETQSERCVYLQKQLTDLDEAKKDLERIIEALEQESRSLFKQTFEAIRSHFQKNFSILFNGGEADLKFTDSSDVLEAGIEIIAKPPGKQMRSISLLSGGEKCLTALALLFSIFEVRPAPFCILDEIDAPLDDSNIGRFTNLLQQFTPSTQFIIVTHNKKTMGVADLLIGVSMEEKGVSKLISLEFEKKLAPAWVK